MPLTTLAPLEDFLASDEVIQAKHPAIAAQARALGAGGDAVRYAEEVFHFVRDEVAHSWDIQGTRVTRTAVDVLYLHGLPAALSSETAARR